MTLPLGHWTLGFCQAERKKGISDRGHSAGKDLEHLGDPEHLGVAGRGMQAREE